MTQERASVQSFVAHANKIDILVPTWYSVDDTGLVWGGSDPLVMPRASTRACFGNGERPARACNADRREPGLQSRHVS
jgi:hypothetical protein